MHKYDNTYRVGRCPNTHCSSSTHAPRYSVDRPAYAWKKSTGLRLDDGMKCPRCGSLLNKTSREVHYLHEMTEDELLKVYETTLENLKRWLEEWRDLAEAWRTDETPGRSVEAREYNAEKYDEYAANAEKDYWRVYDGYRKWLASGTRSGPRR